MSPTDRCEVGSQVLTYDQMVQNSARNNHLVGWALLAGAGVAVIIVLYTITKVAVGRRRRRRAATT